LTAHDWHAAPENPVLHVHTPLPAIPSEHVPWLEQGADAPPGQAAQLGPKYPDKHCAGVDVWKVMQFSTSPTSTQQLLPDWQLAALGGHVPGGGAGGGVHFTGFGAVTTGFFGAVITGFGAVVVGFAGAPPPSRPFCFSSACDATIDPNRIISAATTRSALRIVSSPGLATLLHFAEGFTFKIFVGRRGANVRSWEEQT